MTQGRSFLYTLCRESNHQRQPMQGLCPVIPTRDAVRRELRWTHYRLPSQIDSKAAS